MGRHATFAMAVSKAARMRSDRQVEALMADGMKI